MINVAAVTAQFGAYYKPGSDNEKNLREMIYNKSRIATLFQDRPTTDTIWRGTMAELNRIVQPFQKAWTPIGELKFTPNEVAMFKLKIDLELYPDDIEATYLGFLGSLPELDRKNWPLVRYLIEKHAMSRKDKDMLSEYFLGVYAAPGVGVAGAANTAMNGLRKVIRDYNTAGKTNLGNGPIASGAAAADDADFCVQVEEWVEALPDEFKPELDVVIMSDKNARKYMRGKRKKYNINYAQVTDLMTIEDQSNIRVVGDVAMNGSDLFFTTIPDNRIRPIKKAELGSTMQVESAKRAVQVYTDWWEALNFEVPQFIFHNDQDLA